MGAHQARAFALKYFQRNSTVLINGHLGMKEDVGRTESTACHWCLIPFELLQTGPAFTLKLRLVQCAASLLQGSSSSIWSSAACQKVRLSGPDRPMHSESALRQDSQGGCTHIVCYVDTSHLPRNGLLLFNDLLLYKAGSRRNAPAYSSCPFLPA